MSTRVKSRTWTQVDKFHHKKPNQLIYDQFAKDNEMLTYTITEQVFITATFNTCLLKIVGDIFHRQFVLWTVGEVTFTATSCYEPLVKIWAIITDSL
jgi:hypothetical protein